jgi:hypothetical protein
MDQRIFMGSEVFLGEDFRESKKEEVGVFNASEISSEELDLRVQRLSMRIGSSVVEEGKDALFVLNDRG